MITYRWDITNLQYQASDGGVVVAYWQCYGFDGTYQYGVEGTASFTPDSTSDGFTPLENLTEDQVLSWVFSAAGVEKESVEAHIAAKIEEDKNPTKLFGLPWAVATPTPEA